jgi:diguanylate cyclase (GGDEF)-like protein
MHDDSTYGSPDVALDTTATVVIPIASDRPVPDAPPGGGAPRPEDAGAPRRDTPLLPGPLPLTVDSRATLTVLTGLHAGRIVALDGAPVTIGRAQDVDVVLDETGVSRHHARVMRSPGGGFHVEDLRSVNGTFVGASRVDVAPLEAGDLLQLGPHLRMRFAIVDAVDEALSRQLYDSSVRDALTHVFNRRYLVERLVAEIARARRSGGDVSVLMIDVDSLKVVNDSFGHLAGDRLLSTVAARILRALRVEDVLARYGGDEFVVIAVGTDRAAAEQLAERVRRAVAALHMSARGRAVRITTSIGVAALVELAANSEPVALLALADARMYGAKASGRNKVSTACAPPKAPTAQHV